MGAGPAGGARTLPLPGGKGRARARAVCGGPALRRSPPLGSAPIAANGAPGPGRTARVCRRSSEMIVMPGGSQETLVFLPVAYHLVEPVMGSWPMRITRGVMNRSST
ncbi:uncharacterized protein LOC144577852 isoform X2 [Callithrix jacchus]